MYNFRKLHQFVNELLPDSSFFTIEHSHPLFCRNCSSWSSRFLCPTASPMSKSDEKYNQIKQTQPEVSYKVLLLNVQLAEY